MNKKTLRLPPIQPVPLTPMASEAKRRLIGVMLSLEGEGWRPEVQDYVKRGFACIWINLCLRQGVAPPDAAYALRHGKYKTILPLFVRAVAQTGLYREAMAADWLAPDTSRLAASLWKQAKAEHEQGQALISETPCTVPAWAQALGYRREA